MGRGDYMKSTLPVGIFATAKTYRGDAILDRGVGPCRLPATECTLSDAVTNHSRGCGGSTKIDPHCGSPRGKIASASIFKWSRVLVAARISTFMTISRDLSAKSACVYSSRIFINFTYKRSWA